jgi:hypothetical protein
MVEAHLCIINHNLLRRKVLGLRKFLRKYLAQRCYVLMSINDKLKITKMSTVVNKKDKNGTSFVT